MSRAVILYSLMLGVIPAFAYEDADRQAIAERIAPVGQVHVETSAVASPAPPVSPANAPALPKGQAIYEKYCIICHQAGLAGAPKFRDPTDWQPRLTGKKISDLVVIATQGLNAMPPKGTCVECTDSDLQAAIEYMVPKHD